MIERTEITLSKNKLIAGCIFSLIFVMACLLMMFNTHLYKTFPIEFMRNPLALIGVLSLCMLFFLGTGMYSLRKIFDKESGLVIDANGIIDNTTAASIGLVKWEDITSIETKLVTGNTYILVNVSNPEGYISRANGKMKEKLMWSNMKLCGSPICILPGVLKYKLEKVETLLQTEFDRYKYLK